MHFFCRKNLCITFVLFYVFSLLVLSKADQNWCLFFDVWPWEVGGKLRTCRVSHKYTLNSSGTLFSLPRDSAVKGIEFFGNSRVSYLPVNINESFPNLYSYGAGNCSIKSILRENFVGLTRLKEILLFENFIKKISADVFKDLEALEFVNLGEITK